MTEPFPAACWSCSGLGYKGMDACNRCATTGSVFWAGGRTFPNTKAGYEEAKATLEKEASEKNILTAKRGRFTIGAMAPSLQELPVADENYTAPSPEQFHREMERLHTKHLRDPEAFHSRADKLMQDTLKGLGYADGVKVFCKALRWYA